MMPYGVLIAVALSSPAGLKSSERIVAALTRQALAWNRGDLNAALESYCPDSSIVWVNRSGLSRGFQTFAKSMRDEFGDKPAQMGVLNYEVLESRELGRSTLVVVRWSITRESKRIMGGVSTQVWAKCQGATRVVFEHAS